MHGCYKQMILADMLLSELLQNLSLKSFDSQQSERKNLWVQQR